MAIPKRDEKVVVMTAQLAAMLHLSERRIQQLREAGMPRQSHGKWDLMVVIPWFMEHQDGLRAVRNDPSLEAARKRKLAVDTQLAEHKLAQEKGQAVSLAEHKAVLSEAFTDVAQTIEAFPVRHYTDPEERAYASRFVHALRTELAESIARAGVGGRKGGGRSDLGAASGPEREPVGGGAPDAATA